MAITKIYKGTNDITSTLTKAYKGNTLIWENTPPSFPYVKFVSDSSRTITPKYTNAGVTLQYSIDGGNTWVNIASGVATPEAQEILMRGEATGTKALYTNAIESNAWVVSGDAANKLHVNGNLNYLLCDVLGSNDAPLEIHNFCFAFMFCDNLAIRTSPDLPATKLGISCYSDMFRRCTSLVVAPDLPATTLGANCYINMFRGCTSLVTAQQSLPATTLQVACYQGMFLLCTALTESPLLYATTLAQYCYNDMFYACGSLNKVTMYYEGIDISNKTSTWLSGVATTGILYKAGTQFTTTGENTYPATWTQVQI